jgi:hypothetical protein
MCSSLIKKGGYMGARKAIEKLGGQSAVAAALGKGQSMVAYWVKTDQVPAKWHAQILDIAATRGVLLSAADLVVRRVPKIKVEAVVLEPVAKWRGEIDLGGDQLECYVLGDGRRVISLRATVKAIANADSGDLAKFIGVSSLNSFINKDLILSELIEFSIPGTQLKGLGMTTEHFELICRGYVQALYQNAPLTQRQREIAIKCAVITSGLTRIGLDALIDEATGYQYERDEDALQVKLRAFIADELRAWEKTFPDGLWEEFGRLTNWGGSLHSRPKYWGKLVIELIYDTLDPDVAQYLRENRPPPGIHWHRNLSSNYGVQQLVSRCYEIIGLAKSCQTMQELRKKVAHHYGKQTMLFGVYDDSEEGSKDHLKKLSRPG